MRCPTASALLSLCSASGAYQKYKAALEDQRREKAKNVEISTKKRKAEEMKGKRRKLKIHTYIYADKEGR